MRFLATDPGVGVSIEPRQIIAAGCCLVVIVIIGFYLASRGGRGR